MTPDPHRATPGPKTHAEFDAERAQHVAAANDALASLREFGCRWWSYSVSHCTLELVVGDPLGRGANLAIFLASCKHISGPVEWEEQQLRVFWECDRQRNELFTLQDDSVKFRAIAGMFGWRRNYDLLKHKSLYCPQRG